MPFLFYFDGFPKFIFMEIHLYLVNLDKQCWKQAISVHLGWLPPEIRVPGNRPNIPKQNDSWFITYACNFVMLTPISRILVYCQTDPVAKRMWKQLLSNSIIEKLPKNKTFLTPVSNIGTKTCPKLWTFQAYFSYCKIRSL